MTHKTLDLEHADLTFQSINNQDTNAVFDHFYIYNTHSDELSNDSLLELYNKYNLQRFFKQVDIFDYDPNTNKSLGGDVIAIKNFCLKNYEAQDRVLLLKSDIILSKNYFEEIKNIQDTSEMIYFTAPFIAAKKRVTKEEIINYSLRDSFIESDDITFFVENRFRNDDNDFKNRPGVNVTDESIKFVSCTVIRDFSCHYFSLGLFELIRINQQSWGGVWLENLVKYFIETTKCFTIHQYHDIKSENRTTDREGPVEQWLTS